MGPFFDNVLIRESSVATLPYNKLLLPNTLRHYKLSPCEPYRPMYSQFYLLMKMISSEFLTGNLVICQLHFSYCEKELHCLGHIQNSVKPLRCSVLQKYLTAFSR